MSIFERAVLALLACAGLAVPFACGVPGACLRNSDCDPGLACAIGQCVVPPVAAADAGVSSGGSVAAAADAGGGVQPPGGELDATAASNAAGADSGSTGGDAVDASVIDLDGASGG